MSEIYGMLTIALLAIAAAIVRRRVVYLFVVLGFAVATILLAMLFGLFARWLSFPLWASSIGLTVMALALYVGSGLLTAGYVERRAPTFANKQIWDLTSGTGIVPKWVSAIGLLGLACLPAAMLNLGRSLGWF